MTGPQVTIPRTTLYSDRQIGLIRAAGKIVAECLQIAEGVIKPGATTAQINEAVAKHMSERQCTGVFLGYTLPNLPPFPAVCCISPNGVIIHGVPDDVPLNEGDIVSVDIGVRKDNYIGDGAWTFPVGQVDVTTQKLLDCGKRALAAGIQAAKPKGSVRDIAKAVQDVAEADGFSTVREFCGHGVGHSLHEAPSVPNYVEENGQYALLRRGMVFAIEPMINEGAPSITWPERQWIVRTADGKRSVHFEHTVTITDDGVQVLTER